VTDPAASVPSMGGPVTTVEIEAGSTYRHELLINEFATLERLPSAMADKEIGTMRITCQRSLAVTSDAQAVAEALSGAPMVTESLTLRVRRDDVALQALIARLATTVSDDRSAKPSLERTRAISQLASLRLPAARPYLERLADHPDPEVKMRVQRALLAMR
jgi:hypothetical protein